MKAVPAATPVTVAVVPADTMLTEPVPATLVQVPPSAVSVSVTDAPVQMFAGPIITEGAILTTRGVSFTHPVAGFV